ncbi:MAG: cytochrome C [Sulfuricurvum sp.]|uniref:c-type cytochrome n=1 Tax=Sulfuricurvum sp. TaxID=2025608 RepID=UPI00262DB3EB|nr:c-type cytochrome [Sulfuricurvum sp.]MDD2829867.1 cytochrome C [Sulfuricurvum sp.]MDD4949220.1 cytochrome C [Sulfuricurvum sp.]
MKKFAISVLTVLSIASVSCMAEDGTALYKKCEVCHGAQGEKAAMGKSKIIKDMSKAEFTAALKGYQDGSYGGGQKALMKAQSASLTDGQIKAIADRIAK